MSNATATPVADDHGRTPYRDPTGDTAVRNVEKERREAARAQAAEVIEGLYPETRAEQPATGVQSDETPLPRTDAPEEVPDAADGRTERDVREAAKYRKRAQEAETERDELRTTLNATRAAILDGIVTTAGDGGATIEAVLAGGHDVGTMFTADGRPDVEALEAARLDVEKRFGITRHAKPLYDRTPRPRLVGGSNPGEAIDTDRWRAAFTKRK